MIHGGGWVEGDKEDMGDFVELIQLQHPEHAIININYALASFLPPFKSAFPNQFLDVDAVIDQITGQSEELQLLPEFGLIGASAGAHISLIYDSVYDTDDQVKFVANIVGPSDFTDPFFSENPQFELALSILVDENQYPPNTNLAETTSPVFQVNSNTSPTVMFYGNQDPLVPLANGNNLDIALSKSQITHSYTVYEGGHGDNWSAIDVRNLQIQISEYITEYLQIPVI